MINLIKKYIAGYIIKKEIPQRNEISIPFGQAISRSHNFLLIMPEDEYDFFYSIQLTKFLEAQRKVITIFTYDFKIGLIPEKHKYRFIEIGINDKTKLELPSVTLRNKLKESQFDVVIDLNRKENSFHSFASQLPNSQFRIGFQKKDSDKYYNIHFVDKEENGEISYKNFLNFLKMF